MPGNQLPSLRCLRPTLGSALARIMPTVVVRFFAGGGRAASIIVRGSIRALAPRLVSDEDFHRGLWGGWE